MTEPTIEQVANEARNLVPDATDEQATVIERWAMTLCGQSQEKGKEEVRSCVSVSAVTPVTAGSFCYAPDGCLLGRATNTAERGEQVGIRIVPESGENAYNPTPDLGDIVRCAIQGTVDGAGIENLTARDLARVAIETIREHGGRING